jgi:hypothetical protein
MAFNFCRWNLDSYLYDFPQKPNHFGFVGLGQNKHFLGINLNPLRLLIAMRAFCQPQP